MFCISVKDNSDLAFLNDSTGQLLASIPGETEVVGVGVDCFDDSHCEQIACQTGTCVNYECVYDNATQGTACDDGQFCTATDECDGDGARVGTGDPCGNPKTPNWGTREEPHPPPDIRVLDLYRTVEQFILIPRESNWSYSGSSLEYRRPRGLSSESALRGSLTL